MKISAIVPLPEDRPASVFTPIGGQPALARVVESLCAAGLPVVVVGPQALQSEIAQCVAALAATVLVARHDFVRHAVEYVRAESVTHVLVADPRQVLVAPAVIARVMQALAGGAARVVPVVPVTDTVKTVDAQRRILTTVDRSTLRAAQYPYGAAIDALDDSGAATVDGDPDAILADLPADAPLIEALIACR